VAARDARRAAAREAHLAACTSSLPAFSELLAMRGLPPLARAPVTTVMVNIGKLCNLSCRHCHVESSPARTAENMGAGGVARVLQLLAASPTVRTLDVTGGAPELNAHYPALVAGARALGLAVISRCNLTVLALPGQEGTPAFLAAQGVRVVASLPATTAPTVDRQRGAGVWAGSLAGLRRLCAVGYGREGGSLQLDLVYNPAGARLPPPQALLEQEFRAVLQREHGIHFNRLLALTNMPIKRFADDLVKSSEYEAYMGLLCTNFNPRTVPELMCRGTLSVGWDGRLWDCE
jgi:radical SAM/Cys-rich protein